MTLQVKEFELLVEIYKYLWSQGQRPDLAIALLRVINRANAEQERAWAAKHRPSPPPEYVKRILAKEDKPLMQRLLDAGYPTAEMYHHESDLYVYVTSVSTAVIECWCKEHQFDRTWHCPTFYDQITCRLMYDCAFQYIEKGADDDGN